MRPQFALFPRVLLRRDDGSALVEFAIVLGLILLSAIAAAAFVGGQSERTLATLSDWDKIGKREGPKDRNRSAANTAGDTVPTASDATASDADSAATSTRALTLAFAGLAILGYVGFRQHRVSRRRAIEKLEDTRELIERLDDRRYLKRQEILKVLSADPDALMRNELEVRHLMSTWLRTVGPKTTLDEMRMLMAQEQLRHFPVLNDAGRLVGIVSDRDLMNQTAQKAADVMSCGVVTVSPRSKLGSAFAQMVTRNVSCLPVTEGETLVGILTTTDAMLTLQCLFQLWQRMAAQNAAETEPALA